MKQVLITGATGFLGGTAARDLRQAGWQVITTGRNSRIGDALCRDGFLFQPCDLAEDPITLRRLMEGCQAVVHCAGLSSPWGRDRDFNTCNVVATKEILDACRDSGARLIHISTPSVAFSFVHQSGLNEEAPWTLPPANQYIATKRAAELLVKEATGVPSITLRPKALIGPGDTTLLPRVIRTARRGFFPKLGNDDPRLDLTWVGDATNAIRLALEAPDRFLGKIYHITSGQPMPVSEVFSRLFEACGLSVRFLPVSTGTALAAAGCLEWISHLLTAGRWEPPLTRYSVGSLAFEQSLDISAARRDLGYVPQMDIREALAICGKQWRENQTPHS